MKKILLILLIPFVGFGQYSNYYKVNANIKKNVNVSGRVTTTQNINTIDYGQLALANAEKEKNRLANMKYADEKQRLIAMEIASDPSKAYDYGVEMRFGLYDKSSVKKSYGFKKLYCNYIEPHTSLFQSTNGFDFQNISSKNITTTIKLEIPFNPNGRNVQLEEEDFYFSMLEKGAEEYVKVDYDSQEKWEVGRIYDGRGMLHKVDINRTVVFGKDGFLRTLIYEDDYGYYIQDFYLAVYDGIIFNAIVVYTGDKDEVAFEDLEGRRHYFKRLCNQIISTAYFSNDYKKY
tara:strand:- start:353 stop:1222 length:870 start_codon:yes stop_codon:yes gene_type:complete